MRENASNIAARLARHAEAVCRYYLPNGRRSGRYWIVGDVANTKGSSLYVRLSGPDYGPGAAGKWTDAATGELGDLLDLIRAAGQHHTLREALEEASRFLAEPQSSSIRPARPIPKLSKPGAFLRLFSMASSVAGTAAETYLRARNIKGPLDYRCLRYHPACYYRAHDDASLETWPALLAAVTDLSGAMTALQRTWLARDGNGKAPIEDPRRAIGALQHHAVRLGEPSSILIAGEGLETMLSLRDILPGIPAAAALSSAHLGLMIPPPGLTRLYIAADNDPAGDRASERLSAAAAAHGIDTRFLVARTNDFNADLQEFGHDRLRRDLLPQLDPTDRALVTQLGQTDACAPWSLSRTRAVSGWGAETG